MDCLPGDSPAMLIFPEDTWAKHCLLSRSVCLSEGDCVPDQVQDRMTEGTARIPTHLVLRERSGLCFPGRQVVA